MSPDEEVQTITPCDGDTRAPVNCDRLATLHPLPADGRTNRPFADTPARKISESEEAEDRAEITGDKWEDLREKLLRSRFQDEAVAQCADQTRASAMYVAIVSTWVWQCPETHLIGVFDTEHAACKATFLFLLEDDYLTDENGGPTPFDNMVHEMMSVTDLCDHDLSSICGDHSCPSTRDKWSFTIKATHLNESLPSE
jgi:hypothetical protein